MNAASSHGPESYFLWVDGSPSAAENPPHDGRWRAIVRDAAVRKPPFAPDEIGLDFFLEPQRQGIDLDNLVRLAIDGLRDAGAVARGGIGLDTIVATKRDAPPLGLAITVAMGAGSVSRAPLFADTKLEVDSAVIPREGSRDDKVAWREAVRAAYGGQPVEGPVALDIRARTQLGLTGILKPIMDGLEAYLGKGTAGGREFTPLDDRIVLLRVRRSLELNGRSMFDAAARCPRGDIESYRANPAQS